MKRISGLYEKIISIDNLKLADKMARRGKRNSYGVKEHDLHSEENILKLHLSLMKKTYRTSPYTIFKIYDHKEREVYRLPYYPDRILHWAIMLQLEPIWMSIFTTDTYSCIKGRGIHGAARKMNKVLNEDVKNTQYCLKMDIQKYYPSIDQKILMNIIERKIKCKDTLNLLYEIITSVPHGVPIGNYISQFAANLYLAYFDHWIKEEKQVKYYFRYCDDMVILASEKEYLHKLFIDIKNYLSTNLALTIKKNYQIFPIKDRGIDFVGYRFYHSHVLLRKRIKTSMMKKLSQINKLKITAEEYNQQMAAYWGWVSQPFASTHNLIKKINNMKQFSDFNIKSTSGSFDGKKISIEDLFNTPIIVLEYKIEDSKFTGKNKSDKRLQLSIEYNDEKRITFTGSDSLMEMIKQVPVEDFPFTTIIKKKEKRFEFT